MRSFLVLLLLGLALAAIAFVVRSGVFARKDPGKPINSAMRAALSAGPQELSGDDEATIAKKFPNAQKTTSGLRYIVKTAGEGATPTTGARVTAHYDGRLLDGTKFDSSYDRGEPFTFTVGRGEVIKGWDEAFLDMRAGEKRILIIPYWLGYGPSGRGPIPPRATLVFEVQLVGFQ